MSDFLAADHAPLLGSSNHFARRKVGAIPVLKMWHTAPDVFPPRFSYKKRLPGCARSLVVSYNVQLMQLVGALLVFSSEFVCFC